MLVARHARRMATIPQRFLAPSLAAVGFALMAEPALATAKHGGGHDLVLFLLLIPLVNELLFKPVFRLLDAREERIDGARRRAALLEHDAAAVLERYRAAVSEVRAESDAERKATLEAARQTQAEQIARERVEAERRMEATKREIDGALESARESLRRDVEALAREAATRILGRALS